MPISVLLVDDEPLYAMLLAQRLSGRDFVVAVAADGDEALASAAQTRREEFTARALAQRLLPLLAEVAG